MVGQLLYKRVRDEPESRSHKVLANVIRSFLFRGVNVGLSLLIVPLSINYLDTERYGIWLTLSSVLTWINLMDIGLGNGLRNKLVKALGENDYVTARKLTSTTYLLVTLLISAVVVLFLVALPYLDLNTLFNTQAVSQGELVRVALVAFLGFCLLLILKPLTAVIMATQNAALDNLILLLGNLLSIGCMSALVYGSGGGGSLLSLVVVFSLAPVVAYLLGSLYLYKRLYPFLAPSFAHFDRRQIRELAGPGIQFFIIQISATLVLTSNNVLLSHFFGNEEVTRYNVLFRYFSVITLVQTIILTPIWSAVTEAYQKGDFDWIRSIVNKLLRNSLLLSGVTAGQVIAAPWLLKQWIGDDFTVSPELSLAVAVYTVLITFSSLFSYVINGLGRIRLQTYTATLTTILSVPVALFLAGKVGPVGVVLANSIWLAVWLPVRIIQYHKIVGQTASGIWFQ